MAKLNRKWLTLEHYQQVYEREIDGVTVTVCKPRTMAMLPAFEMMEVLDALVMMHIRKGLTPSGWMTDNPDRGAYDMQVAMYYEHKTNHLYVYICALLCRPFSMEARQHYEERMGLQAMDRLLLMWDSRHFDYEHPEYKKVFTFEKEECIPYLYMIISKERDIKDETTDALW